MFIVGFDGQEVNEYNLSTAYDVLTASHVQEFYVGAHESSPQGIAFSNDGMKMFVVGSDADNVNEYNLSTAFDVSTSTLMTSVYLGTQATKPQGISFNNDGTKMYVIDYEDDNVLEYDLSTAFDVSTASYFQGIYIGSEETLPGGVVFNNDGTKMYVVGMFNNLSTLVGREINEYTLGNPYPPTDTVCINSAITNITYNTTGATGIGTATGLPTGLTANWSSNVLTISGTPSVAGTFSYSVPLTGGCGSVAATGTITVKPNPTVDLGSDVTICQGDSTLIDGGQVIPITYGTLERLAKRYTLILLELTALQLGMEHQ